MDPSTDHPPNKIKKTKIKISLTACPIDHSCQRNFARYAGLRWVNVTDLGSVSSASYVIADHYIFAIFGAVALHERPGSLRDCVFFPSPFCVLYQYNVSVKSKLQHPPPGIPRGFDVLSCPGGREFDLT